MFDPSFFELLIICVVALLVLGPDRLPGAIKTLGLWIGRLRRSFNNIRREIEQEVGADEIRRQLRNEQIMEKFRSTKNQFTESIDSVKKEAESIKDDLDLKKELSDTSADAGQDDDSDQAGEVDPIEKLATNDPSARTAPPPQTTPEESTPAEKPPEDSPESADEPRKQDKTEE